VSRLVDVGVEAGAMRIYCQNNARVFSQSRKEEAAVEAAVE
jgi:hypothetical protein